MMPESDSWVVKCSVDPMTVDQQVYEKITTIVKR